MATSVGILFIAVGTLIVFSGLALVIAEIISGRHSRRGPTAHTMAGYDWNGIAAVLNGFAAIFKALSAWQLPALLILLGLVFDTMGVWILAAKPF
jgi:hypothetical protein